MKNYYVNGLIIFCTVTIGIFLWYSHKYDTDFYKKYYYNWDKLKDFLLLFGYLFAVKSKLRIAIIVLSSFFFLRLLWQIFELENYKEANKPYWIDILFGLCVLAMVTISVLPSILKYAKSRRNGRT